MCPSAWGIKASVIIILWKMKQGHKEVLYKLKMKQNENINKSGKIISWHTLIFKKILVCGIKCN